MSRAFFDPFLLAVFAFAAVLLAGCGQPQAVPTPSPAGFQGFRQFEQNAVDLQALRQTPGLQDEDNALIASNEKFLAFKQQLGQLDNNTFSCSDEDAYLENLKLLQQSVDEGSNAVGLMQDPQKKSYWQAFFSTMQKSKDSYLSDLQNACG